MSKVDGSPQWTVTNLSQVANAPLPASRASAFATASGRHIFYLAPDRQIVELFAPSTHFVRVHSVLRGVFDRSVLRGG